MAVARWFQEGPGEGLRFGRQRSPRLARAGWIPVDSGRRLALPPDGRWKGADSARWSALRQCQRYYSEDGKAFWLAGSEGVAHYMPTLWQTPEGLAGFDLPVYAAFQDPRGHLWFAATDYLAGTGWRGVETLPPTGRIADGTHAHRKPDGKPERAHSCQLRDAGADGRDARVRSTGRPVFEPSTCSAGRQIVLMAPRKIRRSMGRHDGG